MIFFIIERRKGREEVMTITSPESNAKFEIKKVLLSPNKLDEKILMLDNIAKEFFNRRYGIDKNADYAELSGLFDKKKKILQKSFCEKMIKVIYGGEDLDSNKFNDLISHFQQIVSMHEDRLNAPKEIKLKVSKKPVKSLAPKIQHINHKPHFNKEHIKIKRSSGKKHKRESERFIGSIDILDRIEHKIKSLRKEL